MSLYNFPKTEQSPSFSGSMETSNRLENVERDSDIPLSPVYTLESTPHFTEGIPLAFFVVAPILAIGLAMIFCTLLGRWICTPDNHE